MTKPVAVVTGAGSGIGRAVTTGLRKAGYGVALLGRTPATLEETAAISACHRGGGVLVLPTDVTVECEVDAAFATVRDAWGRVDVLVNNAGGWGASGTVDEISVEDWRATVEVNLTGMFLCARAAFRAMRAQSPQGGRIVNNGSVSAHVPRPRSAAYTATKHAVTGLTKALSLDGRPFDIRCSQIDIGNAATAMTRRMAEGVPQADGSVRAEPTFDTRHVADAVVHLAGLPLSVDVPSIVMTAGGMPFLGRG
ncbi:MAG TPA: SDR family oxidoreductase [Marmoricola sp.]|nr:SDR family oxidoreductase [Marmoricola sp.]